MPSQELVQQFVDMTGATKSVASFYLESSHDDLMQALDAFFETGGAEGGAAAAAGGGLAADEEGPGDLVGSSGEDDDDD
eukprot:CAMPEP_0172195454 /NCGR_PEP_ID=MMETSP1050-20130122/26216_1 /TAXON_ID=233186 /ORGANISM="Cryptomonas curvata, Strain CCAP979/52" /LENGTH=78 /DNA_ID=CAMNT_0012871517 /DNA_START=18 /DNA_END=251 /DNA_ORIENTATION=+